MDATCTPVATREIEALSEENVDRDETALPRVRYIFVDA